MKSGFALQLLREVLVVKGPVAICSTRSNDVEVWQSEKLA
jgi:hypothetical protein